MPSKKDSATTKRTLSLFWHYTKKYPLYFWTGSIGVVLAIIIQGTLPPFIIAKAFVRLQTAYVLHQTVSFSSMLPYIIGFLVCMVLGFILWRVQGYAVWQYEIRVSRDMITDVFNHVQRQSERFHADRFGGALVSQSNKFVSAYERLMDEFTWGMLTGSTVFIASTTVMLFVAPKFALLLIAVIIVYIAIMSRRIRRQFPYNRREAESDTKRTAALADAITNVGNIRTFAEEDYELERFHKAATHTFLSSRKLSVEVFKTDSISQSITNGLRIVSVLFGIFAITNLHANAAVLYLVVTYTVAIVDNLYQFSRIVRNVNRSFGDAAEMTEILDMQPEVKDRPDADEPELARGEVVFENVDFQFADKNQKPLFEHLNVKLKPGEKIGLVGHSGGGKTTITKLLLRFMDIQGGRITIDGHDIATMTQANLRRHIAYVAQEPLLFHRSLAENISYGSPEADDEAIHGVAKLAHADDFIRELADGYDTMVGERGVKLSGGQRQRVVIARAMLKNAPILVLDEATSALDSESEALIQDALWKLMEGRTAIVIAHRLSTIQHMDRIIVLDKGKVVEQGTHKELIRQDGAYAALWKRQSGGFLED